MARKRIYQRSSTPGEVACPFTVLVDSNEGLPYQFEGLRTNEDEGAKLISVPRVRTSLEVGDYQIDGLPSGIVVERKSKSDLFGSIVKRDNMELRLTNMSLFSSAHWVIEAELSEIHREPASQYNPKSLVRSVMAWTVRYPGVHWWFCPHRRYAEQLTFRLMEKYWVAATSPPRERSEAVATHERRG